MRIRTIKPEFWKHPTYGRLDDHAKWVAIGLLCMADDEGYFLADPNIIRAEIDPFREDLATISRSFAKLCMVGWCEQVEHVEMGMVGRIVNWERHQKVDHPKSSKIKQYFIRENFATTSRDSRENFALDQGSGIREQGSGSVSPQATVDNHLCADQAQTSRTRFVPPSSEEVLAYCKERGGLVDGQKWYDYYQANGWKVGRNPMKDWRAAVRTWERNGQVARQPAQQKRRYFNGDATQ